MDAHATLPAENRRRLHAAETWIFDLDNTLYPASCRLFDQVDRNITEFICQHLSLSWDEAYKAQKTYFRQHGTTLRGLMDLHGTDPDEFLEFVHDIDVSPVDPSPELDAVLSQLRGRKFIFTNGSQDHAGRVMTRLGVGHHFEGVFDIIDCQFVPKPEPAVYEKLVNRFGIDPSRTVMVEDIARNLVPAAAMGMATVWVRTDSEWAQESSGGEHVHHVVDDLIAWLQELVEDAVQPASVV